MDGYGDWELDGIQCQAGICRFNAIDVAALNDPTLIDHHDLRADLAPLHQAGIRIELLRIALLQLSMHRLYKPCRRGVFFHGRTHHGNGLHEHANTGQKLHTGASAVADSQGKALRLPGQAAHSLGKCRLHKAVDGHAF